jgi:hypothetical protein
LFVYAQQPVLYGLYFDKANAHIKTVFKSPEKCFLGRGGQPFKANEINEIKMLHSSSKVCSIFIEFL